MPAIQAAAATITSSHSPCMCVRMAGRLGWLGSGGDAAINQYLSALPPGRADGCRELHLVALRVPKKRHKKRSEVGDVGRCYRPGRAGASTVLEDV